MAELLQVEDITLGYNYSVKKKKMKHLWNLFLSGLWLSILNFYIIFCILP